MKAILQNNYLLVSTLLLEKIGQGSHRPQSVWVLGPQHFLSSCQCLLIQLLCLAVQLVRVVGEGEIMYCSKSVRMIRPKQLLVARECLLE